MPTKSIKHRDFVSERMGEKGVTKIAGLGEYGEKLAARGFDSAYSVLGQFLLLKKQKDLFLEWLDIEPNHGESCFACLSEWCELHL
jgi:hypothetical protein